jgi:hypothetical protein
VRSDAFSSDTREFLRLLAKHGVRYVIVGGTAVIYHGYARLTGDVDFFYDSSRGNVERLWEALVEFWDGAVPGLAAANELASNDVIVQFGRPPNRIDLIGGLSGVSFEEAWRSRVLETIELGGQPIAIHLLGLAELVRAKRAAGRPKDLDDLEHLGPRAEEGPE